MQTLDIIFLAGVVAMFIEFGVVLAYANWATNGRR